MAAPLGGTEAMIGVPLAAALNDAPPVVPDKGSELGGEVLRGTTE